jgi:hypothetical protein
MKKIFVCILLFFTIISCKRFNVVNNSTNSPYDEAQQEIFESNIAKEIACFFVDRKVGTFPGVFVSFPTIENISTIDDINLVQGFYIQQQKRMSQRYGRMPEILVLSIENENVIIREIDVINDKIIIRKEIIFYHDGKTFVHERSRVHVVDGTIQILYLENVSENNYRGRFEHSEYFSFAGSINEPIPDSVKRLTSDYLQAFTGNYIFDSYSIIFSDNKNFDINLMKNTDLRIDYDIINKWLTINSFSSFRFFENIFPNGTLRHNFIETQEEEPFYWIFGERGGGYIEVILHFFKNGIVFFYEEWNSKCTASNPDYDTQHDEYIKYVVFFKKDN